MANFDVYFIIVAVNLGLISEGLILGWSSPSLPRLLAADSPITINTNQSSWIASLLQIGVVTAVIFSSKLVDILGRKKLLIIPTVPLIISWIIIGMATTHQELYAARFIAGIGLGIMNIAIPIYLAEVTPARMRGMACGLMYPCILLGEVFIFTLGPRLTIQSAAWSCLSVPVLQLFLMLLLPESPYFLVMKGRYEDVEKFYRRLHGTTEVAEQIRTIKMTVQSNSQNRGGIRDLLTKRSNLKVLGIALGALTVQEFSGLVVIGYHMQEIFSSLNSNLSPNITYGPVFLKLVCGGISVILMDRTGKKPLMIFSVILAAISMFTVALFISLKSFDIDVHPYRWIPVTAIFTYSAAVALGLTLASNVIVGELFALNVKAVGHNVYRCTQSFYQFIMVKLYQVISDNFGMQYPFWIFTVCLSVGVFFVIYAVPETKGKTLEEIQEDLLNATVDKDKILPLMTRSAQTNNTQASHQDSIKAE